MKVHLIAIILVCFQFITFESNAGPAYAFRVQFKDKNGSLTFADSSSILSPKALLRRSKQNIAFDSTDLPVVQAYIDSVMSVSNAVKLHNVSKWFNQIVVITFDSSTVTAIAGMPMVSNVKLVARYQNGIFKSDIPVSDISKNKFAATSDISNKTTGSSAFYGNSFQQIDLIQADCLHDLGFRGEGMDIAVLDVNFRYANTCAAFDSLNIENRIIDTKNFVKDTDYVFSTAIPNDHGMNTMSCMASNWPTHYVGSAPKANFFLYITEDYASEQPIEEDNWLSAAERADSIGVDIINTSLGYNIFDQPFTSYSYVDLNGMNSLIVRAANKAVSKGIFVVAAQGNEGAGTWLYMLTPADGDSVYSVGSIDGSGAWGQSGYGPTFTGTIKPDGVCVGKGVVVIGGNCQPGTTNGSSFAAPTMCGAIACLWQAFPNLTAWQLKNLVRSVSSIYNSPNNTLGYGIPNFCNAYNLALDVSDINSFNHSFALFPNPTNGAFNVVLNDSRIKKFNYCLMDLQGNKIYQSQTLESTSFSNEILKNQSSGTYLLMISTPTQVYTSKILKQ